MPVTSWPPYYEYQESPVTRQQPVTAGALTALAGRASVWVVQLPRSASIPSPRDCLRLSE
ncbi:hypothetical protein ACIF80_08575 [Streptomyces sp. NPDC085927]|uniref:hypothetical protein n=1 Tax=Streptomyces sp. NPDC085927 TaxID=3365738 RepID=UPI0037D40C59